MITVQVEYDEAHRIVVQTLREDMKNFEEFLERQKSGLPFAGVFESDKEKDMKLLKKHIKACKRLIEWYGG